MKTYVERETGQLFLPGLIIENPECKAYDEEYDVYCRSGYHHAFGLGESECPKCNGTGKEYGELDYEQSSDAICTRRDDRGSEREQG